MHSSLRSMTPLCLSCSPCTQGGLKQSKVQNWNVRFQTYCQTGPGAVLPRLPLSYPFLSPLRGAVPVPCLLANRSHHSVKDSCALWKCSSKGKTQLQTLSRLHLRSACLPCRFRAAGLAASSVEENPISDIKVEDVSLRQSV